MTGHRDRVVRRERPQPSQPSQPAQQSQPPEQARQPADAVGSDATDAVPNGTDDMELYDLRVSVERIEGRSVCGLSVGDYFELVRSSELRIPDGKHFCIYALQAVLPLLPAKQRRLPENDWLERDSLVCCPDPDERVVMRIERTGPRRMRSADLT